MFCADLGAAGRELHGVFAIAFNDMSWPCLTFVVSQGAIVHFAKNRWMTSFGWNYLMEPGTQCLYRLLHDSVRVVEWRGGVCGNAECGLWFCRSS